jgi:hypothetical protein
MMNLPAPHCHFLGVYGKLHHGDVTTLLNKNAAFGDCIHVGQNERSPDTF